MTSRSRLHFLGKIIFISKHRKTHEDEHEKKNKFDKKNAALTIN